MDPAPVLAPISPAANITAPPIKWPINMAVAPSTNPKGATSIPVKISAMEIPAPNHNNPLLTTEVFIYTTPLFKGCKKTAARKTTVT